MAPVAAAATAAAQMVGLLAGAALVKQVIDAEQRPKTMAGGGWRPPRCATCNGTGRVTCICTRWSDGDVGCRTCAGSGRKACSSCGGSGTGTPIPARIVIKSTHRPP